MSIFFGTSTSIPEKLSSILDPGLRDAPWQQSPAPATCPIITTPGEEQEKLLQIFGVISKNLRAGKLKNYDIFFQVTTT